MDEKLTHDQLEYLVRHLFEKLYDLAAECTALREMLADQHDIDEAELELRATDIKKEHSMRVQAWNKAVDVAKGYRDGSVQ